MPAPDPLGHTATLIDELGLIVVVGGLSAATTARTGPPIGTPRRRRHRPRIKMPRGEASVEKPVEVLVPEILNPDPRGAPRAENAQYDAPGIVDGRR